MFIGLSRPSPVCDAYIDCVSAHFHGSHESVKRSVHFAANHSARASLRKSSEKTSRSELADSNGRALSPTFASAPQKEPS